MKKGKGLFCVGKAFPTALLCLFFTLVFALSPLAASYYYDPSAKSGGDGSRKKPFSEISEITLKDGDVLTLEDGEYGDLAVTAESGAKVRIVAAADAAVFKGVLKITGGDVTVEGVFFENAVKATGCEALALRNLSFCGSDAGVGADNSYNISFENCDFLGCRNAVSLEACENVSASECLFTSCDVAVSAAGVNFGYGATKGKSGFLNCFARECLRTASFSDCRDVAFTRGHFTKGGLDLKRVSGFYIEDAVFAGCEKALKLEESSGDVYGCLFYNCGAAVSAESPVNDVKISLSAADGETVVPSGAAGIEAVSFEKVEGAASRFGFNKDGDDEGFGNAMGVRVSVGDGYYSFEPDNNYLYVFRDGLYSDPYLCSRVAVDFGEETDLYGVMSVKTLNGSPWISGGQSGCVLEGVKKLFVSEPFSFASPIKDIEFKFSLVGRHSIDSISFLPDIKASAKLISDNVLRLTLSGVSRPVFSGRPALETAGTESGFTAVFRGGKTVDLVFEKSVLKEAASISLKPLADMFSEPFCSLLSGKDIFGLTPADEAAEREYSEPQNYPLVTVTVSPKVEKTDFKGVLLNIAFVAVIVALVAGTLFVLYLVLGKRNRLRKFAKKGRKALKNRRRSKRF